MDGWQDGMDGSTGATRGKQGTVKRKRGGVILLEEGFPGHESTLPGCSTGGGKRDGISIGLKVGFLSFIYCLLFIFLISLRYFIYDIYLFIWCLPIPFETQGTT